ncbi:MAG: N-acetyltransferase family protein [Limisphaerales bacterium]
MSFVISQLVPAEIPDLLTLVHELARFERLEHEVEATAESLRDSFFGPKPVAGALIARQGRDLAGYAIYFFTFSSFVGRCGLWLDDVYVRPAFRRQGLGRALLVRVGRLAAERCCGRFEWSALRWNQNALQFYAKLGAKQLDEWVTFRMNEQAIKGLVKD